MTRRARRLLAGRDAARIRRSWGDVAPIILSAPQQSHDADLLDLLDRMHADRIAVAEALAAADIHADYLYESWHGGPREPMPGQQDVPVAFARGGRVSTTPAPRPVDIEFYSAALPVDPDEPPRHGGVGQATRIMREYIDRYDRYDL